MERVRIEGLFSLKSLSLSLDSIEESYFANLNSLRVLRLDVINNREINNGFLTSLFEIFPNIEELHLHGQFSSINFDSFVNLKKISLYGNLLDDFNFDVFDNICNRLKEINVKLENMNDESFTRLFYGRNFPNLLQLNIVSSKITRLEKELFDGFPNLKALKASKNKELKTIAKDAFSNSTNLRYLYLVNNQLTVLHPELFSCLTNFKHLFLGHYDTIFNIKELLESKRYSRIIKGYVPEYD